MKQIAARIQKDYNTHNHSVERKIISINYLLGEGRDALVYQAQLEGVGLVALKRARYSQDPSQFASLVNRFQNETIMLSRLHHKNIVTMYQDGTFPYNEISLPYIAETYAPYGTLEKFSYQQILANIEQIVAATTDALSYLHGNKISHGDIKPSNFLLGINGILLGDFGTARRFGPERIKPIGTPEYMAPEQQNPGIQLPESDQYALEL